MAAIRTHLSYTDSRSSTGTVCPLQKGSDFEVVKYPYVQARRFELFGGSYSDGVEVDHR